MVANEYKGLKRRLKRGIDEQSPSDPNGVDIYQQLSHDTGGWEQGRLIGKAHGGHGQKSIMWE